MDSYSEGILGVTISYYLLPRGEKLQALFAMYVCT